MANHQDISASWNRHDVKRYYGISDSTFWRWLRSGRLKGFYVGAQLRFRPEDVQHAEKQGREQFDRKWKQRNEQEVAG